jgi:hypothetical protein
VRTATATHERTRNPLKLFLLIAHCVLHAGNSWHTPLRRPKGRQNRALPQG